MLTRMSNVKAPLSAIEVERRNSKRLWSCEILFQSPVLGEEMVTRKQGYNNLFHKEFRELRSSIFSEGVLYEMDPGKWIVAPPGNIRIVYASPQKKFIE